MPRKSWLTDAAETIAAAPTKVVQAVKAATPRRRDPFYTDDERKRAIAARGGRRQWIPKRPDWLRRAR